MENIPDDPIIACMERTGEPPWNFKWYYGHRFPFFGYDTEYDENDFDSEEEPNIFYGNSTADF